LVCELSNSMLEINGIAGCCLAPSTAPSYPLSSRPINFYIIRTDVSSVFLGKFFNVLMSVLVMRTPIICGRSKITSGVLLLRSRL
jgi:hypothetical protein